MPSQRQGSTELANGPTNRGLGTSSTNSLQAIYSSSPVFEMGADDVRASYENRVLNGTVKDGYGFSEFKLDYNDAPAAAEKTGGGGLPGSNWAPNPTSPGEGNGTDPSKQGDPPSGWGTRHNEGTYGGGPSVTPSAVSAADASAKLAQTKCSGLTLGKSQFTAS